MNFLWPGGAVPTELKLFGVAELVQLPFREFSLVLLLRRETVLGPELAGGELLAVTWRTFWDFQLVGPGCVELPLVQLMLFIDLGIKVFSIEAVVVSCKNVEKNL